MSEKIKLANVLPKDIENRSMEIIESEIPKEILDEMDPLEKPIIKRAIHTSADFDYLENLKFSKDAVKKGLEAIKNGAVIVTDTNMAKAGINKKEIAKYGGEVLCFMADEDVALEAKTNGTTRATACINKAAKLDKPIIFAIGNAPTALVRIYELVKEGKLKPELVIGVPVGFVNVVESKELILQLDETPFIVARGRKGGSNVAASICNAILYMLREKN